MGAQCAMLHAGGGGGDRDTWLFPRFSGKAGVEHNAISNGQGTNARPRPRGALPCPPRSPLHLHHAGGKGP